jgi:hypothetical protein
MGTILILQNRPEPFYDISRHELVREYLGKMTQELTEAFAFNPVFALKG